MSSMRLVGEVARWEFLRYIKPKQQLISLLVTVAVFLVLIAMNRTDDGGPSTVEIAVVGGERISLPAEIGRFRFEAHGDDVLETLRAEVESRDRNAVLVVTGEGAGELIIRHFPSWRGELVRELSGVVLTRRLEETGLDMDRLAALQEPFALEVTEVRPRSGGSERLIALLALMLTAAGLMTGIGYVFASITGEKQNRLSEQVISAIRAQAWIDGKVLGLAGVSVVAILNFVVAGLITLGIARVIWGTSFQLPTELSRPDLLLIALVFITLGYFFWFAFLAAVSAIVDDPHNSNRNQLIFLPLLSIAPAVLALNNPEIGWIRILAIVPPTSGSVLPTWILVAEVPWWQVGLAFVLLFGAVAFVRRIAGKVFRLGMLMYGKEPSWREVRRWLREA